MVRLVSHLPRLLSSFRGVGQLGVAHESKLMTVLETGRKNKIQSSPPAVVSKEDTEAVE